MQRLGIEEDLILSQPEHDPQTTNNSLSKETQ